MSWIQDIVGPGHRRWEELYRNRNQSDRVVRSTHGVNCTGSCSWNVHVKNGVVALETQATDYPKISGAPPVPAIPIRWRPGPPSWTTRRRARSTTGLVGAAGALGGFFPPLVLGAVRQATGSFTLGFAFLAAFALLCLAVVLLWGRRAPRGAAVAV